MDSGRRVTRVATTDQAHTNKNKNIISNSHSKKNKKNNGNNNNNTNHNTNSTSNTTTTKRIIRILITCSSCFKLGVQYVLTQDRSMFGGCFVIVEIQKTLHPRDRALPGFGQEKGLNEW